MARGRPGVPERETERAGAVSKSRKIGSRDLTQAHDALTVVHSSVLAAGAEGIEGSQPTLSHDGGEAPHVAGQVEEERSFTLALGWRHETPPSSPKAERGMSAARAVQSGPCRSAPKSGHADGTEPCR
jgi:hypothetical protein